MINETVAYWLCCGSIVYPHGEKTCYEARMGYSHHVRFGTRKEHSDWQKKKVSNPRKARQRGS